MREYQKSSDGSVHKKLSKGRWEATIRYRDSIPGEVSGDGKPVWGPWRQKSKLLETRCNDRNDRGKKRAVEEMRAWRKKLEDDEPDRLRREELTGEAAVIGPTTTISAYVDHYLKERLPRQKKIEPSTLYGYERRAGYINEHPIGKISLCELRFEDVESFRNWLLDEKSGYSARDTLRLLKAALNDAVSAGHIDRSPAAGVKCPSPQRVVPNVIDEDGRESLRENLDAAEGSGKACADATWIALETGMREGEICGLQWCDVDMENMELKVRRSIGRSGDGYYLKGTKTGSSRREIPISRKLEWVLYGRLVEVRDAADEAGVEFSGNWYVVGTFDEYMKPHTLAQNWRRRVERLGLIGTEGRPPKFHDLRHTFATVAAASGTDPKSLSAILGHASVLMSLDVYAAPDRRARKVAMERISRAL